MKRAHTVQTLFFVDKKILEGIKTYLARRKELGEPLTKEQTKTMLLHKRKELIVRRELTISPDKRTQEILDSNYTGDLSNKEFTELINKVMKGIMGEGKYFE